MSGGASGATAGGSATQPCSPPLLDAWREGGVDELDELGRDRVVGSDGAGHVPAVHGDVGGHLGEILLRGGVADDRCTDSASVKSCSASLVAKAFTARPAACSRAAIARSNHPPQ